MFKKVLITIICLYFLVACGRKGDPEYQANLNSNQESVRENAKEKLSLWDL